LYHSAKESVFVELLRFGQELLVMVDKLFLKGSVERSRGIHRGSLGIGVPMVFVQPAKFLIEVLHELRAIVGKHGLRAFRQLS